MDSDVWSRHTEKSTAQNSPSVQLYTSQQLYCIPQDTFIATAQCVLQDTYHIYRAAEQQSIFSPRTITCTHTRQTYRVGKKSVAHGFHWDGQNGLHKTGWHRIFSEISTNRAKISISQQRNILGRLFFPHWRTTSLRIFTNNNPSQIRIYLVTGARRRQCIPQDTMGSLGLKVGCYVVH